MTYSFPSAEVLEAIVTFVKAPENELPTYSSKLRRGLSRMKIRNGNISDKPFKSFDSTGSLYVVYTVEVEDHVSGDDFSRISNFQIYAYGDKAEALLNLRLDIGTRVTCDTDCENYTFLDELTGEMMGNMIFKHHSIKVLDI